MDTGHYLHSHVVWCLLLYAWVKGTVFSSNKTHSVTL